MVSREVVRAILKKALMQPQWMLSTGYVHASMDDLITDIEHAITYEIAPLIIADHDKQKEPDHG